MTTDINTQQLSNEPIEIDYDHYEEPREFAAPLTPGVGWFKQGKVHGCEEKELKTNGLGRQQKPLSIQFEAHELWDEQSGKPIGKLMFDQVSNSMFKRGNSAASMMNDQLIAVGNTDRPKTNAEFLLAVQSGEGKFFHAQHGWEGFCAHKETPFFKNDPKDGTRLKGNDFLVGGVMTEEVPCKICQKPIRAGSKISRRLPAQSGNGNGSAA